jgi:hypothetical protein
MSKLIAISGVLAAAYCLSLCSPMQVYTLHLAPTAIAGVPASLENMPDWAKDVAVRRQIAEMLLEAEEAGYDSHGDIVKVYDTLRALVPLLQTMSQANRPIEGINQSVPGGALFNPGETISAQVHGLQYVPAADFQSVVLDHAEKLRASSGSDLDAVLFLRNLEGWSGLDETWTNLSQVGGLATYALLTLLLFRYGARLSFRTLSKIVTRLSELQSKPRTVRVLLKLDD